ncbi:MAG: HNH endonuclease [Bacteroidetes bacterium GWA2_32_17]|nr:MAG: HNH endonuclease [Bacteroidetes bacterium GWA2_32_17]
MKEGIYIHKKEVDWSLLHYGLNIPVALQVMFYESIKEYLKKGDAKKIKIVLENQEYFATLTNIYFNQSKYPNHKELLQIRYTENSPIAKKLQAIFSESYKYLVEEKNKLVNKRIPIKLPTDIKEYVVLYTTQFQDTFYLECITLNENQSFNKSIEKISEEEFELTTNYNRIDLTATIAEKIQLIKIRKLDRSICDNLKTLYDYRCQITGDKFGEKYKSEVSEAHHIEYFTKSMNNDSENIIIVSPNFHRLIHKTNPVFDRNELTFIFQNGVKEKLKLNYHL